jgi:hypothetical protein
MPSTAETSYRGIRRTPVTAIEAGTDPAVINPRLADLRAEREAVTRRIASLESQDRLSPVDIDELLAELGGLGSVLGEATPPEKASIYHGLGLHLVYHPADNAVVATADLGRASRVGGATRTLTPRAATIGSFALAA